MKKCSFAQVTFSFPQIQIAFTNVTIYLSVQHVYLSKIISMIKHDRRWYNVSFVTLNDKKRIKTGLCHVTYFGILKYENTPKLLFWKKTSDIPCANKLYMQDETELNISWYWMSPECTDKKGWSSWALISVHQCILFISKKKVKKKKKKSG